MEHLYAFQGALLSVPLTYRLALATNALLIQIKVKFPPGIIAAKDIARKERLCLFVKCDKTSRGMAEGGREKLQFPSRFEYKLIPHEAKIPFGCLF